MEGLGSWLKMSTLGGGGRREKGEAGRATDREGGAYWREVPLRLYWDKRG